MTYNPESHHRRSIRIKGHDYSQAGAYFVTVCVKDRACLFGFITNGQMQLNLPGQMVTKWWFELPNKFCNVEVDEFVVMPNHIHGIIKIVGADLRVCPDGDDKHTETGEHTGSPLHRMVQWFKTMSTNDYIRGINDHGWDRFNGKLWQRNYYEHIIRNDLELHAIREYISYNPLGWDNDDENPHIKGRDS
jgi:REP element-mobilizing transposase RayT